MSVSFTDNSRFFIDAKNEAVVRALEAIGQQAEGNVKLELETPKPHADGSVRPNVQTGNLVNSISHRQWDAKTEAVGTAVEYGKYLEFGTSRMRAYPFLKPGVANHVDEYKAIAERYLKGG